MKNNQNEVLTVDLTTKPNFASLTYGELDQKYSEANKHWKRGLPLCHAFSVVSLVEIPRNLRWGVQKWLSLEDGRKVHVSLGLELYQHYRRYQWDKVEFEIRTLGGEHFLCMNFDGGKFIPISWFDHSELVSLCDELSESEVSQTKVALNSYHTPSISGYSPLEFGEVMDLSGGSYRVSHKFEGYQVGFTQRIVSIIDDLRCGKECFRLSLVEIDSDHYRLDFSHTTLIGGSTICFIKREELDFAALVDVALEVA